ncbi:hypothetical protein D3C72_2139750 [compost metagenome]
MALAMGALDDNAVPGGVVEFIVGLGVALAAADVADLGDGFFVAVVEFHQGDDAFRHQHGVEQGRDDVRADVLGHFRRGK